MTNEEDTKRAEESRKRQKFWEGIGRPMSAKYAPSSEFDHDYHGTVSVADRRDLIEAQQHLKFIAYPQCQKDSTHGRIVVARLHIMIQDDIMTVFPAIARCLCYRCGFEELWPLDVDPRNTANRYDQEMYIHRNMLADAKNSALAGMANNVGLGSQMTSTERAAQDRLRQQVYAAMQNTKPLYKP
jgi:hypothetical protein